MNPTVTITSPANNTATNSNQITVSWSSNDDNSGIDHNEIYLNGTLLASTVGSSYDVLLSNDGNWNITIVTIDQAGNINKTMIWVYRDTISPNVNVVSPANNTLSGNADVTLQWSVNDDRINTLTSTVIIDGVTYQSGITGQPGDTLSVNIIGLTDGTHVIEVVCTDEAGNVATTKIVVTIDTTAPNINISTPANETSVLAGSTVTMNFTVSDANNVQSIEVFQNGTSIGTFTTLDNSIDLAIPDTIGTLYIEIVAVDEVGNSRSVILLLHVGLENVNVEVQIIQITNDTWTNLDLITLNTTISGNLTEVTLQVLINGSEVYNGEAKNLQDLTLSQGINVIELTYLTGSGDTFYYKLVVKVDVIAPTISDITLENNTILTETDIMVNWTVSDDLSGINNVNVSLDGEIIATGAITGVSLENLEDGSHELLILIADNAGNIKEVRILFEVETGTEETPPSQPIGGTTGLNLQATQVIAILMAIMILSVAMMLAFRRTR